MALQKSIALPNGATGSYIRIGAYTWDRQTNEASAHLMLHTDAAFAESAPNSPLCLIAKLRLNGSKFLQYLGNDALSVEGVTVLGQLYSAAKVEPLLAGAGLTTIALDDAQDV